MSEADVLPRRRRRWPLRLAQALLALVLLKALRHQLGPTDWLRHPLTLLIGAQLVWVAVAEWWGWA